MRLHSESIPKSIYVCRGCYFINDVSSECDKCPYCSGDDWAEFGEKCWECESLKHNCICPGD